MVEFITIINGILVALKVTRFEITFASRTIRPRMYITKFNPISCARTARAIRVDHKGESRIGSRGVARPRVRVSHTDTRHEYHTVCIVVEDEWHSEGRVDPFTIYRERERERARGPWGFPPCRGALSHLGSI